MATFQNISKQHCDWVVLTYEIYDLENQCKNKLSNLLRSEVPFTQEKGKYKDFCGKDRSRKAKHMYLCVCSLEAELLGHREVKSVLRVLAYSWDPRASVALLYCDGCNWQEHLCKSSKMDA